MIERGLFLVPRTRDEAALRRLRSREFVERLEQKIEERYEMDRLFPDWNVRIDDLPLQKDTR